MSLGTTLCLALSIVALLCIFYNFPFAGKMIAIMVLIISLLRYLELMVGTDYLDPVFIWITGVSLNHTDGAMSFLTSICLALIAVSISFSDSTINNQGQWKNWIPLVLTFYVIFLVTIAASGYFLNLIYAFTWMGMRMSPHTAMVMLVLSVIIHYVNFNPGLNAIYKTSIRQRFSIGAIVILFFLLIIFLILKQQINYIENQNSQIMSNFIESENIDLLELQNIIKREHDVREFIWVLVGSFSVV
jgi:hypothetical protein